MAFGRTRRLPVGAEFVQELDGLIVDGWLPQLKKQAGSLLAVESADEFLEMERAVFKAALRVADLIVALLLRLLLARQRWCLMVRRRARKLDPGMRPKGVRSTPVRLLGGSVIQVRASYWVPDRRGRPGRRRGVGRRGPAGVGVFPELEALGIRDGATPALQAEVARQVAECTSLSAACANLAERGVELGRKTVRRLAYRFGQRALEARDEALDGETGPDADLLAGRRVVVCVDGGRYRQRVPAPCGRRRKDTRHRGYKAPWREPKVFVIYAIDEDGGKDPSVTPLCDSTTGNADAVFDLLLRYLRAYGADRARQLIFCADGAHWIWDRVSLVARDLGVEPDRVVEVLDFYHAVEHLAAVADLCRSWSREQRKRWIGQRRRELRDGHIDRLIEAIRDLCTGRNAKKIDKERAYFQKNRSRARYDKLRRRRVPRGSGAVESAVRRIINLRLKGNGIFWIEENAERVMHMRAQLKVGRWNDLVRRTIALPAHKEAA